MENEHGAVARDRVLAIGAGVVKLNDESHCFKGNLLKLRTCPPLPTKNE